jgi:hypothetical protein
MTDEERMAALKKATTDVLQKCAEYGRRWVPTDELEGMTALYLDTQMNLATLDLAYQGKIVLSIENDELLVKLQ